MKEKHYCENCKDRIFRKGFKINNTLYCKRCVNTLFGVRFNDFEYTLEKKETDESKN